MPSDDIKGLYAIIDYTDCGAVERARKILAGGCRLIQLRAKEAPTGRFLDTAHKVKDECSKSGALLIVNDRVDIAMACGADGVHLGQDDLPLPAARQLMGRKKIIGISTHNMDEAIAAEAGGADYIGFGPVFATSTKKDAEAAKGIDALRRICSKVAIPVVAIGGIKADGVRNIIDAGAMAVAMISELAMSGDIEKTTAQIMKVSASTYEG